MLVPRVFLYDTGFQRSCVESKGLKCIDDMRKYLENRSCFIGHTPIIFKNSDSMIEELISVKVLYAVKVTVILMRTNSQRCFNFLFLFTNIVTMSLLHPFISSAYAYSSGMWGNHMFYGFGYGFMGEFFMFIFWLLIIGAIVYAVMQHSSGYCGHNKVGINNSALNILKERYAKGEIDKAEFEEKKKDLS